MEWIRHGDVILEKIDEMVCEKIRKNEEILAIGEMTGHVHKLLGDIYVSETMPKMVEVIGQAELLHDEHDTLVIPEGKYRIVMQRESDLVGEIRQVMD